MNDAKRVELAQGPVHYREVGSGPSVVFVHGLLVNGRLWEGVAERLSATHRCLVPDWPLGSHPEPMNPDADLSPHGVARLIADFLERLDLKDVTLVGNDSGGALCQMVAARHPERIGRLVLTTCDAFEYFPPPAFKYLVLAARVPPLMAALAASMRWFPILRRLPIAYGWLTRKRLPSELLEAWVRPTGRPEIRRDVAKFIRGMSADQLSEAARSLAAFKKPVLLIWTPEDGLFPVSLAHRLIAAIPHARLELVPEARVFVGWDQPARVAELLAA